MQDLNNGPIALLTRHRKEMLLASVFQEGIGCHLVHTDVVDTDTLGSFTREIPRQGTQREAARKKAELGAKLTGCRFGIGSEGAFVTDPWTGMMPWNLEMVLLLDTWSGLEIVGIAEGPGMSLQREVKNWSSLEEFAAQAGFPDHHLVMRPDNAHQLVLAKGIDNPDCLRAAFEDALSRSVTQQVFVENDLRAHCNPMRQAMIVKAAQNLVERLHSSCPECNLPDFWMTALLDKKVCSVCRSATKVAKYEKWSCRHCSYSEKRKRGTEEFADPVNCEYCNP